VAVPEIATLENTRDVLTAAIKYGIAARTEELKDLPYKFAGEHPARAFDVACLVILWFLLRFSSFLPSNPCLLILFVS
jgi:hypothetical protein